MFAAPADDNSFLLKGATVHTMAGAPIENGSVLVRNGKIIGVGKNLTAPKDIKVIDAKGMQVYPGMIDSATEMGLTEVGAIDMTVDTTELGRFNPELVALTAVNPESEHIPITRANGITDCSVAAARATDHRTGLADSHGGLDDRRSGSEASRRYASDLPGHCGRRRTRRWFVPDADPATGAAGGGAGAFATQKQNYDKAIVELDGFFEQARRYKQAKDAKAPSLKTDLKLEAMLPVIDGKEPILVTARREREIRDAITWADKQKVKIILVDAVEAMKVTKEIKDLQHFRDSGTFALAAERSGRSLR